jgi:opacity protein-like surface antigen
MYPPLCCAVKKVEAGYAVGGGLEYVFAPGWSAKLEYQYIDLGDESLSNIGSNLRTETAPRLIIASIPSASA